MRWKNPVYGILMLSTYSEAYSVPGVECHIATNLVHELPFEDAITIAALISG